MKPRARRKSQRGIRRFEAPCFESNSERMADAGAQSMSVGHYTEAGPEIVRGVCAGKKKICAGKAAMLYYEKAIDSYLPPIVGGSRANLP